PTSSVSFPTRRSSDLLMAGFFWACANLVVKTIGRVNMLHFMVWSSGFAVPPLFLLSWWLEGPPSAMLVAMQHASALVWGSVLWQDRKSTRLNSSHVKI